MHAGKKKGERKKKKEKKAQRGKGLNKTF